MRNKSRRALRISSNLLALTGLLGLTACEPPPSDASETARRNVKCEEYEVDCDPPTPPNQMAVSCSVDLQNVHISTTARSRGSVLAKATITCSQNVSSMKFNVNLMRDGIPVGVVPQPTVLLDVPAGVQGFGVNTAPCASGWYKRRRTWK
jgi:hypothetical protein